jgi:hypothetical protein
MTLEEIQEEIEVLRGVNDRLTGETGKPKNREEALAVTKIQEAIFWLAESQQINHSVSPINPLPLAIPIPNEKVLE